MSQPRMFGEKDLRKALSDAGSRLERRISEVHWFAGMVDAKSRALRIRKPAPLKRCLV